jgi:hypothetical protein
MSTRTAHFSITGEFMTDHCRQLWHEREFSRAFKVLDCCIGMTREQQESLIMGSMKLVGVNDLDFVPDNWNPPEGYCTMDQAFEQGKHYPELLEMKRLLALEYARKSWWETRANEVNRHAFDSYLEALVGKDVAEGVIREVMEEIASSDNDEDSSKGMLGQYYARCLLGDRDWEAEDVLRSIREREEAENIFTREPMSKRASALDIASHHTKTRLELMGFDVSVMPDMETVLNRGYDKKPVLCPDMSSASGWLLPDGKFYGCGPMEHIGLAGNLLPKAPDPETEAERRGWIKIAKNMGGLYVLGQKKPTQKQLNKLQDYAEFHKKDYHELIETLPNS